MYCNKQRNLKSNNNWDSHN